MDGSDDQQMIIESEPCPLADIVASSEESNESEGEPEDTKPGELPKKKPTKKIKLRDDVRQVSASWKEGDSRGAGAKRKMDDRLGCSVSIMFKCDRVQALIPTSYESASESPSPGRKQNSPNLPD